jgi:1,4-alpha-glucan branching enzyme
VQALVRDLNATYRARPELHERDFEADGFAWVACNDSDASVLAFLRRARGEGRFLLVVCNFTPVVRRDYRVGVPAPGSYREVLNTDSEHYGGSNVGNLGVLSSEPIPAHGYAHSLAMSLPPLATLYFEPLERG